MFLLDLLHLLHKPPVSGMGRREAERWAPSRPRSPGDSTGLCWGNGASTKETSFIGMAGKGKKHGISIVLNDFMSRFVIPLHHLLSLMHTLAMCSWDLTQWLMSTLGTHSCGARTAAIMSREQGGSGDSGSSERETRVTKKTICALVIFQITAEGSALQSYIRWKTEDLTTFGLCKKQKQKQVF